MIRLLFIFIAMFALGILIAVVVRTSHHQPYAMPASSPTPATSAGAAGPSASAPVSGAMDVASSDIVNSICAICGMPVNPKLGTALYHEKRIGFGCKTCPAQFAANPEKYGPSALKNLVAE